MLGIGSLSLCHCGALLHSPPFTGGPLSRVHPLWVTLLPRARALTLRPVYSPCHSARRYQHKLHTSWSYWELRKKEPRLGLSKWEDLPLMLYTFDTVEDFWLYWKRTPLIT